MAEQQPPTMPIDSAHEIATAIRAVEGAPLSGPAAMGGPGVVGGCIV